MFQFSAAALHPRSNVKTKPIGYARIVALPGWVRNVWHLLRSLRRRMVFPSQSTISYSGKTTVRLCPSVLRMFTVISNRERLFINGLGREAQIIHFRL
jgi:hypothetical protein